MVSYLMIAGTDSSYNGDNIPATSVELYLPKLVGLDT